MWFVSILLSADGKGQHRSCQQGNDGKYRASVNLFPEKSITATPSRMITTPAMNRNLYSIVIFLFVYCLNEGYYCSCTCQDHDDDSQNLACVPSRDREPADNQEYAQGRKDKPDDLNNFHLFGDRVFCIFFPDDLRCRGRGSILLFYQKNHLSTWYPASGFMSSGGKNACHGQNAYWLTRTPLNNCNIYCMSIRFDMSEQPINIMANTDMNSAQSIRCQKE